MGTSAFHGPDIEHEGHLEVKGPQGGTTLISRGQWLLLLLRNLLAVPRKVILITLTGMKPHTNSAVLKRSSGKSKLFFCSYVFHCSMILQTLGSY